MKLKIENIIIPVTVFAVLLIAILYLSGTTLITITFKANTAQEVILSTIDSIGGITGGSIESYDKLTTVEVTLSRFNKLLYFNKLKKNSAVDEVEEGSFLKLTEF